MPLARRKSRAFKRSCSAGSRTANSQKGNGRIRIQGPEDLVFATETGTPLDEKNLVRRIIKPIAGELNMPWMGWHVCRDTHSTFAEELGMALSDRQAQMGHSSGVRLQVEQAQLVRNYA
jgi:hypothetical protein